MSINSLIEPSAVDRIDYLRDALTAALRQQDWDAIGRLDHECRSLVDVAMLEVVNEADEARLRNSFASLLEIYAVMVETCRSERDRIGAELGSFNRAQQNAKVYQLFG
ncbi:flagellar protein FliT [Pseudomonas sp. Marseille-QA0892]